MAKKHIQESIAKYNPAPPGSETVWLDTQDMLIRFHVTRSTLQRWRRRGILSYYKVGGKIYYKESELTSLFDKYKVG